MLSWLKWYLSRFAFPDYECQNCIGMPEYGCYCQTHGAVAPCKPAHGIRRLVQYSLGGKST